MKTIRAFVAIEPGETIRVTLSDLQQRLKRTGADLSWVRPDSIHLTLAFLGELPEDQVEPLKAALDAAVIEKTFDFNLAGIGTFGKLQHPSVLWAGITPCPQLERLHQQTTEALGTAGVKFDDKTFSPHLTLGRFKSSRNLLALQEQLEKEQTGILGSATVHEIQLIQSRLRPEGAQYTVLYGIQLQD